MKIQCALQLNYFLWIKFTYTVNVWCYLPLFVTAIYWLTPADTRIERSNFTRTSSPWNIYVSDVGVCWRKLCVRNQKRDAGSPFHCLVSPIRFISTAQVVTNNQIWGFCYRYREFIANPMRVSSSTCYWCWSAIPSSTSCFYPIIVKAA